jgi:hypothetical protein
LAELTDWSFDGLVGLTDHLPLLEKGALLAQRPTEYDYIDELTPYVKLSLSSYGLDLGPLSS